MATPVLTHQTLLMESPEPLFRAVSNALLFTAAKSQYIPQLQAVRFEFNAKDQTLKLVSTDRHRLFVEQVAHRTNDAEDFAFSIDADALKQLITLLRGAGRMATVMLVVQENSLKIIGDGAEITLPYGIDDFPKWHSLIPAAEGADATEHIAFNPKYLADIGKLKLANANTPVRMHFFGATKPSLLTIADGPTLVLMPVRIQ